MKLGLLLIALAVGYKVYADALKEKGTLRSLGQWVGAFVMATSFLASVLFIYKYSGCMTGKGYCPWKAKTQEFTVQVEPTSLKK